MSSRAAKVAAAKAAVSLHPANKGAWIKMLRLPCVALCLTLIAATASGVNCREEPPAAVAAGAAAEALLVAGSEGNASEATGGSVTLHEGNGEIEPLHAGGEQEPVANASLAQTGMPRTCAQHHSIIDCSVLHDFVESATCRAHLSNAVFCGGDEGRATAAADVPQSAQTEDSLVDSLSDEDESLEEETVILMAPDEFKKSEAANKAKPTAILPAEEDEKDPLAESTFNYADSYNGAKLLKANSDSKGAQHILHGDMDKYYYSPCSSNKYVVIQLSEQIKVQGLQLINAERFSSGPREFQVLASDTYPVKEWHLLGEFTAENVGEYQNFEVVGSPPMMRFIKLKWLSQFGSEYACTLTNLVVFGTTEYTTADLLEKHKKLLDADVVLPDKTDVGVPVIDVEPTNSLGEVGAAEPVEDAVLTTSEEMEFVGDALRDNDELNSELDATGRTAENNAEFAGSSPPLDAPASGNVDEVTDEHAVLSTATATESSDVSTLTLRVPSGAIDGAQSYHPAPSLDQVVGENALESPVGKKTDADVVGASTDVPAMDIHARPTNERSDALVFSEQNAVGAVPINPTRTDSPSNDRHEDTRTGETTVGVELNDPDAENATSRAASSVPALSKETTLVGGGGGDVPESPSNTLGVAENGSTGPHVGATMPRADNISALEVADSGNSTNATISADTVAQALAETLPSAVSASSTPAATTAQVAHEVHLQSQRASNGHSSSSSGSTEMAKLVHELINKVHELEGEHSSTTAYLTSLNSNYSLVMSKLKQKVQAQNTTGLRAEHELLRNEFAVLLARDLRHEQQMALHQAEINALRQSNTDLQVHVSELRQTVASLSQSVRQLSAVVGLSAHALQDHWQDAESGCSSFAAGAPIVQNVSGADGTTANEVSVSVERQRDRVDAQQVLGESVEAIGVGEQDSSNQSGPTLDSKPDVREPEALAGAFSALERVFSLLHGITAGLDAADARSASAGGVKHGADNVPISANVTLVGAQRSIQNGTPAGSNNSARSVSALHEDTETIGLAGNSGVDGGTAPLGMGASTAASAGEAAEITPSPMEASSRNEIAATAGTQGEERAPVDLSDREPVSMAITSIEGSSSNTANEKSQESV